MNATALYNTDQTLWSNFHEHRRTLPNGGAILSMHDGMIGNGHECLARFKSSREAVKTLTNAGFKKVGKGQYK